LECIGSTILDRIETVILTSGKNNSIPWGFVYFLALEGLSEDKQLMAIEKYQAEKPTQKNYKEFLSKLGNEDEDFFEIFSSTISTPAIAPDDSSSMNLYESQPDSSLKQDGEQDQFFYIKRSKITDGKGSEFHPEIFLKMGRDKITEVYFASEVIKKKGKKELVGVAAEAKKKNVEELGSASIITILE